VLQVPTFVVLNKVDSVTAQALEAVVRDTKILFKVSHL